MTRSAFILACLFAASPALAADSTQVPEGSALTLFALGLIGVIVGRRGSMRPKDRAEEHERNEP
jgi:hypothetical protein